MDLTDNKSFDDYAGTFGWVYDNGGRYREENWDWYAGTVAHVVLVRQAPSRVCIVRFDGLTPCELWSGIIRTADDFNRMMSDVALRQSAGR